MICIQCLLHKEMSISRYKMPKLFEVRICPVPNQDGSNEWRYVGRITRKAVCGGVSDICQQISTRLYPS